MLLALVTVYAGAWLTTGQYGPSRAAAWLEADTGDVDRFPSRPVPAGGPVLELPVGARWPLQGQGPDPGNGSAEVGLGPALMS